MHPVVHVKNTSGVRTIVKDAVAERSAWQDTTFLSHSSCATQDSPGHTVSGFQTRNVMAWIVEGAFYNGFFFSSSLLV